MSIQGELYIEELAELDEDSQNPGESMMQGNSWTGPSMQNGKATVPGPWGEADD